VVGISAGPEITLEADLNIFKKVLRVSRVIFQKIA
jgi:hypothetical protein